jgi:glucosamine--fructose-6-phosphate aminotransferase (isomerizing)
MTRMEQEAREAPHVLARQFQSNHAVLMELVTRLKKQPPLLAMTIARGSSDHAATFAKYLLEIRAGIITSSAAPSVFTLYQCTLPLKNCLVIAISQSGASPDVAEMMAAARKQGAITVAFVNKTDSTLATAAEYVVPLHAGPELAVAATKTYIATLGALLQFTALLTEDQELQQVLTQLPDAMHIATTMDWSQATTEFQKRDTTLVIGRGYGLPIAQESALKFKETARVHAEAFSGAELMHGPLTLIEKQFPLLVYAQHDASLISLLAMCKHMKSLGALVFLAVPRQQNNLNAWQEAATALLPLPQTLHPLCDPLLAIQAFYLMMVQLTLARGFNPDTPFNLTKVTQTW